MAYCVPAFTVATVPRPGACSGSPRCWTVGPEVIAISGMPKPV
jgi:hypothetical protein